MIFRIIVNNLTNPTLKIVFTHIIILFKKYEKQLTFEKTKSRFCGKITLEGLRKLNIEVIFRHIIMPFQMIFKIIISDLTNLTLGIIFIHIIILFKKYEKQLTSEKTKSRFCGKITLEGL